MTTIEAEHAFTVYCSGKSCHELYVLACNENDVRPNTALLKTLSTTPDDFDMDVLDLSANYLGPTGVHCLLDLVRANRLMRQLILTGQNADDQTVFAVVAAVRNHERLGHIDLSNNSQITVEAVDALVRLLHENKMVTNVNVRGTAIGAATQRKFDALGEENNMLEANFFKGDYVRLKRTFCELDTEGRGRISVSALLTQIEIPQVAAALERRFNAVDEGGVSDGYLDASEFLRFTYPGFNNMTKILEHSTREDPDEEHILANWKTVVEALRRGRMEFSGLHHVRLWHRTITLDEAVALLRRVLECMWDETTDALMTDAGKVILTATAMQRGVADVFGAEIRELQAAREKVWGSIKIAPHYLRLMIEAFGKVHGSGLIRSENSGAHFDVALGPLLEETEKIVQTETVVLKTGIMQAKLLAAGVGGSITVTFPEWFCYVNEVEHLSFYPLCCPKGFSIAEAIGNSPVMDASMPLPANDE